MATGTGRKNFFADTTRGRVLRMLCFSSLTVAELAAALNLTDNAVRAQLAVLQRDDLVRQSGLRKGVRKPHFGYELTPKGRALFPTAYEPVLAQLLDVLNDRLPRELRSRLLRECAKRLAQAPLRRLRASAPRERVAELRSLLTACGPAFEVARGDDGVVTLRACACPLASAVVRSPDLCGLVAAILTDALQTPVKERCRRDNSPRCRFEFRDPPARPQRRHQRHQRQRRQRGRAALP